MPEEPQWMTKAKETYQFHREKRLSSNKWTIELTARILSRSLGSVSEDIMIAKWCKVRGDQLIQFHNAYEAIAFIRQQKKEEEIK